MRKYLTKRNIIVLGLVILAAGWGIYHRAQSKSKAKGVEKVVSVEKKDVVSSLTISGEIKADKQAILNFNATGRLGYIGVKEGDEVKKGQLLASLDLGDLQTAEVKARYSYLAADAYAKKIEDEVKGHDADETFTQKYNRVSAQTARDIAYDAWLAAQRAIRNAKLISPMNGTVSAVTVTVTGDTVNVTDGVTVVDPESLYFSGEVDESDVGKITMNEPVKVLLDAFPGETFGATISEIGFVSGLSSSGATIFPVKIKLDNGRESKLRLGMNGDADIILNTRKNVLSLPIEAVVDGKVTLMSNEAKLMEVKTGLEGDTLVEITGGLNEGDKVVIKQ